MKQAGVAMYMYADDGDDYITAGWFINTLGQKSIFGDGNYVGEFYSDGSGNSGYLFEYLGRDETVYNCPGSEHPEDFGDHSHFSGIKGTYQGFTEVAWATRKMQSKIHNDPNWDAAQGWDDYDRIPLIIDPIFDHADWGDQWDNTTSVIHGNRGTLPILTDDGSIMYFNRNPFPGLWPSLRNQRNHIENAILKQAN